MNKKNNQRYKNSSEKIETAFLALTLNHKYEDISISQICEQANINRSTFYSHYDDINDLIIKIEAKFANSIATIFNYGSKANHETFIEMFKFVKDNKYFYKAFLNIPYITTAEKNTKSTILSNMKDNLKAASFFGAGIKEICRIWLDRDCKETPEEMAMILLKEYTNRSEITTDNPLR